jgi:hypothetical protein
MTMFGRLLFVYIISWLYITNNLPLVKTNKSTPKPAKDIFHISSNLAILPEQQCCIWVSTRYIKLRKLNLSTNYRYGLDLQANRKNSHTIICILLAGDTAINPGPFNLVVPLKTRKVSLFVTGISNGLRTQSSRKLVLALGPNTRIHFSLMF